MYDNKDIEISMTTPCPHNSGDVEMSTVVRVGRDNITEVDGLEYYVNVSHKLSFLVTN